jgi:membrane fusion protein (multidrug efflux system)
MARQFRMSPLVIAVLLLVGLLIYLNLPTEEVKEQRRGGTTPVVTHQVVMTDFPVVVEAIGTANANEAVILTAQNTDIVQTIAFEDGDLVKKGQLLLSLNNREELARVNELEINISEAKRQLVRITNLAKESVASEQLLDEQQARVKALTAQLEVANSQLAEMEVKAPFSGLLGVRRVSVGALVSPGDVITTLDDLHKVKVDFGIAESHLPTVALGQSVSAKSIAYQDKIFNGVISNIDSRVDPISRSVRVRAIIENPNLELRPGMLLQIVLQKKMLNTLVVPEQALLPIQDKQFVYVVKDNKAVQTEVKVGLRKPGIAQIISGINEGDFVVTEGTLRIRNGSAVNVLTNDL